MLKTHFFFPTPQIILKNLSDACLIFAPFPYYWTPQSSNFKNLIAFLLKFSYRFIRSLQLQILLFFIKEIKKHQDQLF